MQRNLVDRLMLIVILIFGTIDCLVDGDEMSTTIAPGWAISSGVWNTDLQKNTATINTGKNVLQFLNTTPASNPAIISEAYLPVTPSRPMRFRAIARASSIAAGNYIKIEILEYDAANSLVNTITVFNDELTAADTWQEIQYFYTSYSTAAQCKIKVSKKNTAFYAYVDFIQLQNAPYAFSAYRNAALALTKDIFNFIDCDTAVFNIGNAYDTTNGEFVVPRNGYYSLHIGIGLDDMVANEYVKVAIGVSGGTPKVLYLGTPICSIAVDNIWQGSWSTILQLTAGQTVKPAVWPVAVSNNMVVGSSPIVTYFDGLEIIGS